MKKLLISGNVILAFLLALSLWGAFSGSSGPELEVRKKKSERKAIGTASTAAPAKIKIPASDEAATIIVRKNVFDPQRSGSSGGRGITTYSLVGFYKVGNSQGAIITSKGGSSRNRNAANDKRYFRIGDTLPNGYTLASIENNQAVLMRGSSRMTLDMAYASEGVTVRRSSRRNVNPMQQMVNLMQQSIGMQRMQQMNMMRMMRNNQSSGTPARGGSTNSRRR